MIIDDLVKRSVSLDRFLPGSYGVIAGMIRASCF
jgi:hypothetical protein